MRELKEDPEEGGVDLSDDDSTPILRGEKLGKDAPPRLYWIDWSRTQSVWNVVCGHVWWMTVDETDLDIPLEPRNINVPPWTEGARMVDYVVDSGTFYTIPLFFLVSGYLASLTMKEDGPGLLRFVKNRTVRIIPPLIFGSGALALQQWLTGDKITFMGIFFSHLWFLWALALVQLLALPFCVVARFLVLGKRPAAFWVCLVLHVMVCVLVDVGFEFGFQVIQNEKPMWLIAVPFSSTVALLLLWAPTLRGSAKETCQVLSPFFLALSFFTFPCAHAMCPLTECYENSWVTINLVHAIILIDLCHMTGFVSGEVRLIAKRVLMRKVVPAMAVLALLLSCYWPYFTYWGPQYIRRNAWVKTYQSVPAFPLSPGDTDDGSMAGGMAPAWAMARMWFWSIALLMFAKVFCDTPVTDFIHRHTTQSCMILYIFHPLYNLPLVKAFKAEGLTQPVPLFYSCLAVVFAASFVTYVVIASNRFTRAAFGILEVAAEEPKKSSRRGSHDH